MYFVIIHISFQFSWNYELFFDMPVAKIVFQGDLRQQKTVRRASCRRSLISQWVKYALQ